MGRSFSALSFISSWIAGVTRRCIYRADIATEYQKYYFGQGGSGTSQRLSRNNYGAVLVNPLSAGARCKGRGHVAVRGSDMVPAPPPCRGVSGRTVGLQPRRRKKIIITADVAFIYSCLCILSWLIRSPQFDHQVWHSFSSRGYVDEQAKNFCSTRARTKNCWTIADPLWCGNGDQHFPKLYRGMLAELFQNCCVSRGICLPPVAWWLSADGSNYTPSTHASLLLIS